MTHVIFEKQLEKHVTMKVILREDKKYTVQFTHAGNVFGFNTDQLEAVASRMKGLHDSIEWDNYFKQMDN